ncbi:hypothetical protein D3C79_951190 [compost metagenome]
MPIDGTELYAGAKLRQWHMTQKSGDDPAPGDQPAQQVEPMQAGQQVEETVGRIAGDKVAPGDKLLPDPELPRQKGNGKHTPQCKTNDRCAQPSLSGGHTRPLQCDATQYQKSRIQPERPEIV